MRKTLTVFLAVVMLLAACLPAGAIQLDAVEEAAELTTALPEEAGAELQAFVDDIPEVLVGIYDDTQTPGLNILTGTAESETFDSEPTGATYILADDFTNYYNGVNEGTVANGVLSLETTKTNGTTVKHYMKFKPNDYTPETSRPYALYFDVMDARGTDGYYYTSISLSMLGDSPDNAFGKTGQNWNGIGLGQIRLNAGGSTLTNFVDGFIHIRVEEASSGDIDVGHLIDTWDNIAMIPAYRMYFVSADGTALLGQEDVLYKTDNSKANRKWENIVTEYNPSQAAEALGIVAPAVEGKEFVGWIDMPNATYDDYLEFLEVYPDGTLELYNQDIIFYPVYVGSSDITYAVDVTVPRGGSATGAGRYATGETATLTAIADSGYEFIGWYNGSECVSEDATYPFTVEGDVSLVAKFQAEDFYQGTAGKPGLNLFDGTNQAYDFEDGLPSFFTGTENTSMEIAEFEGNNWVKFTPTATGSYLYYNFKLENDRKYLVTFDYMSERAVYIHIRQNGTDLLGTNLPADYNRNHPLLYPIIGDEKSYWGRQYGEVKGNGGTSSNSFYFNNPNVRPAYIDNLAIVPYYKVTFHDADGAVLTTKQVLLESGGVNNESTIDTVLTEYDPSTAGVKVAAPDGMMLYGWSTTEGGEAMTSIPLQNEDFDLYPVFIEAPVAPNATFGNEMRFGANAGIRFRTTVTFDTQALEGLAEYGFITTTKARLGDEELTHEFEGGYVAEAAYNDSTDKYFEQDDESGDKTVTAVLTGINAENAAHVNTKFVVRPYMIIETALGNAYIYGGEAEGSLGEAAKAVQANGGSAYENNKTYVDGIVNLAE